MKYTIRLLILSSLCFIVPISSTQSQSTTDTIAIMFVIDRSGSMANNDPNNLRYAATRLIIDVADDWDEIGVICFNDQSNLILPLEAVGSLNIRQQKLESVTEDNCPSDGGTSISESLNQAIQNLQATSAQQKYIFLLTDGDPQDGDLSLIQIDQALQQDIQVIPFNIVASGTYPFMSALELKNLELQNIQTSGDLISSFASIYGKLKPDRYVVEVGIGGTDSVQILQSQNVQQMTLVVQENVNSINLNGSSKTCQDYQCKPDTRGKYNLFLFEDSQRGKLDGTWSIQPGATAVVIAKASFKPRLVFPPTTNETTPGYYISRPGQQTLIAEIEGSINETDIYINRGRDRVIPIGSNMLILRQEANAPSNAQIKLGDSDQPLQVAKEFTLETTDQFGVQLPKLQAINPSSSGQLNLLNDTQARIEVELDGDLSQIRDTRVMGLIINTSANEIVFGPEPLQVNGSGYQSSSLLTLDSGVPYRTLIWLDTTYIPTNLRYGDQLDLGIAVEGKILIKGLTNLSFNELDQGSLPVTVDVTEQQRTVDINASIDWIKVPNGVIPQDLNILVQLQDTQYSGMNTATTLTIDKSSSLCDLPEGEYIAQINFSTSSDLNIDPPFITVQDSISYGDIETLSNSAIDLGSYCTLPLICVPSNNLAKNQTIENSIATVQVDVPECLNASNLAIKVRDVNPLNSLEMVPGEIDRSQQPVNLNMHINQLEEEFIWRDRNYIGNIIVEQTNRPSTNDQVVQVKYRKYGVLSVITPLIPFASDRPVYYSTLIATIVFYIILFLIVRKIWKDFFGSTVQEQPIPARQSRRANIAKAQNQENQTNTTQTGTRRSRPTASSGEQPTRRSRPTASSGEQPTRRGRPTASSGEQPTRRGRRR